MKRALILTDGKAGHENQSKAFARALGCDFDIVEVHFKNTRRGFYRNSAHLQLKQGDWVAVEASPGHDIGQVDMDFLFELGESRIPFAIIFTKADKQGPNVLAAQMEKNKQAILEHWESLPPVFVSSAETGMGREEILAYIDGVLSDLKQQ